MSQYDEDWQRRKEYLTRTLFNDIPYTVLSPIPEESRQSLEAQVLSGSSRSSVSHHSEKSCLSYEEQQTSVSKDRSERISRELRGLGSVFPNTEVTTTEIRCYSPLPPLIIEVEPNKHDEPDEYYERLLVKIRKIYRNMFLESKHVNDNNFSESDLEEDIIEEKGWSSDSNSYNGDLDSDSDTDNHANIGKYDNFANLAGAEGELREFVEDDADMESDDSETTGPNDMNELVDCDINEMDRKSRSSIGDPTFSQVTFKADVHNDGIPIPEITPSPVYEVPGIEVTQSLVQRIPCDEIGPVELETQKHDLATVPGDTKSQKEPLSSQITEDLPTDPRQTLLEDPHYISPGLNVDDSLRSPILQSHAQFGKPSEALVSLRTLLEDDIDDICTNKNKEGSIFEHRMRREKGERFLQVTGNSAMLEYNRDSEPLTSIVEENNYYTRELEVMRSPRLDERTKSLPTHTTRHSSFIDVSSNHNIVPPKISDLTASSEDANISFRQGISNDIHKLLHTTFNISPEVDRKSVTTDSNQNSGPRKRKFQDISVQTQNVSWSELRNNFFVGTPKIFKLCSCVGHNCL